MTDPPPAQRRRNEEPDERPSEPHEVTYIYAGQPIKEIPRNITHLLVDPSVGRIQDRAFENCGMLRSITIPSTVEAIGYRAFGECVSLVDVQLHKGLKIIGSFAFYNCSSLMEIEIPNGIPDISDSCFYSCLSLRTLSMPISVERIDREAFAYCKFLVDISLPKRLNHIDFRAFAGCEALSSVVLPSSLRFVGYGAFYGCTSLLCVEFPYSSSIQFGMFCFVRDKSLVNVSIPRLPQGSVFGDGRIHQSKMTCIENRFSNHPIHDLCYRSSVTTREEILQVLDDCSSNLLDKSMLKDAFDMTPFHIVASSASLNLEVLQCLLDRYPTSILHCKDCYDYTMMDYLLKHTSPRAVPLLHLVLRHANIDRVSAWHPQWGSSLSILVDMIPSNSDMARRRQCVKDFFARVGFCIQMETTLLLELAVWKAKIRSMQALGESNSGDTSWRDSCRCQSKAGVVIENVIRFLWQEDASVDTGLSLFPLYSSTNVESIQ